MTVSKRRVFRRKKYDKRILINVTEDLMERLAALGLRNKSEALRKCVWIGLEFLEKEFALETDASGARDLEDQEG